MKMLELIDRQETLKKMCEWCGQCERFENAMRSTHPDFVTDKCNNYKFLAEQPKRDDFRFYAELAAEAWNRRTSNDS